MSRRSAISTKKDVSRVRLVRKRSADRATDGAKRVKRIKRTKRNKSCIGEEVGEFIVVDTGTVEETGIIEDTGTVEHTGTVEDIERIDDTGRIDGTGRIDDTGTVEDDEYPKSASASIGSDAARATLQDDGTEHQKSSIDPDATQKARDALFALDSILGFVKAKQDAPPYTSPYGVSRQTRITLPSTSMPQSTEGSSGLIDVHFTQRSPPLRNALHDCELPPTPLRLQPSSQEPSTASIPAWEECQPNPTVLRVTRETEHPAPRRFDKPPQSVFVADGGRCSGISRTSIGAQTSQPASIHNLPPHHTGVPSVGTVRHDGRRAISGSFDLGPIRSHTQDSDLPHVPQPPRQTSIQNTNGGKSWTSSLDSRHDQPAQQSNKSGSDNASNACPGEGIALTNLKNPGQISVDSTNRDNSFSPGKPGSASNFPNMKVPADHQQPATSATRRCYGLSSPYYHPPCRPDKNDTTIVQAQPKSAQMSRGHTDRRHQSSTPHHNSMWMSVVMSPFKTSRTVNDKKRLRDRAAKLIAGREDVELEEDETTGGRIRVYPDACGVIVDKCSAKGIVSITAHGFPVQQVDTGLGAVGEPYAKLTIEVGQTCVIHGSSTVLYYKPRKVSVSTLAPRSPQPRAATQPRESSIRQLVKVPSPLEITTRLQMDEAGRFSKPYDISVWSSKVTTTEFFAWFGSQTGRGGAGGLQLLTFTLKDAMPYRKACHIPMHNEDEFRWMRKYILTQFDEAKLNMPGLKEFTVLVTDPGWFPLSQSR